MSVCAWGSAGWCWCWGWVLECRNRKTWMWLVVTECALIFVCTFWNFLQALDIEWRTWFGSKWHQVVWWWFKFESLFYTAYCILQFNVLRTTVPALMAWSCARLRFTVTVSVHTSLTGYDAQCHWGLMWSTLTFAKTECLTVSLVFSCKTVIVDVF